MKNELQHIETFIVVADYQSITEAAKFLCLSKAAVSQSIRTLEESFKVPLFTRTTRSINLTEEGQLLYTQALRVKQELDITRSLAFGFNDKPSGLLKLSCNSYFAETKLMSVLEVYLSRFPQMSIELYTEERMLDLSKENIDIVLGVNFPVSDDIVRKTIGSTRYILCASVDYLKTYGTPKTVKELEAHHYIPHLGRLRKNQLVDMKANESMPKLQPRLKLNDAHFMKQCALKGLGIVQLHSYMVDREIQSGQLVEILNDSFEKEIPLYAYFQRHRFVQPKIRQFINLLEE